MKRREKKRHPSADLLGCFPSRAHLTLTHPKSIYSPGRPSEPKPIINRHRRSKSRGGPILWAKSGSSIEIEEPTSPKVTCSGQIRSVKPNPINNNNNNSKNWQSVLEEIERFHKGKQKKKKGSWSESLRFKKDLFQFFTCLWNLRLDFQCFGGLPSTELTTTTEDEEEEEEEEDDENLDGFDQTQMGIEHEDDHKFSKWFTLLKDEHTDGSKLGQVNEEPVSSVPPQNALLLMRCRSAPAKSRFVESEEEEEKTAEKETSNKLEMNYDEKLYKMSSDIAEETWVVGGMIDQLLRSRSWKR